MNILVTGSNGQLGSALRKEASNFRNDHFMFTDITELDITSEAEVKRFFSANKPDCVINCAAYTAVDQAESEQANANLLNATAVRHLAEASTKIGALMIQISTDYVFDGKNCRPYKESDPTNPKTSYGKSKLNGELEVIFNAGRSVIVRTSWLYSEYGHNFVKAIMNKAIKGETLKVVADQAGTPTYATDLAKALLTMIPQVPSKIRGKIYNYSNEGICSWYDFAKAVTEFMGRDHEVIPIMSHELKNPAARPHYSVLDKTSIKKDFGLCIPHWRQSLQQCIQHLLEV